MGRFGGQGLKSRCRAHGRSSGTCVGQWLCPCWAARVACANWVARCGSQPAAYPGEALDPRCDWLTVLGRESSVHQWVV